MVESGGRPLYQAIADAIAADTANGRLRPGDRLPPQRWLAERMAVNFSTVARAYAEAQRRGLIESRVGRGSFIPTGAQPQPVAASPDGGGDMTMNLPPEPDDPALVERLRQGIARIAQGQDPRVLLRYQDFGGTALDRAAGAQWLSGRLPGVTADQLVVCPGAQGALLALFTLLARPGDCVCCEALTYPGVRALAAHLGVTLLGLPMDADGIDPDAFARACRERRPRALYVTPTLHNPTTLVMPEDRRRALLDIARKSGVPIVEDDAYGALPREAPPSFAVLGSDITYHVAGLSKCLGAGLRIAYLKGPDGRARAELVAALRATSLMASPVTAALASAWIADGTAADLLEAIRGECRHRHELVQACLPAGSCLARPDAFHVWLPLPRPWRQLGFVLHLKEQGVDVVAGDYFAASPAAPEGVRLSIGGRLGQAQLRHALTIVGAALGRAPSLVPMPV
ncbi:MAG: PLP-dependent aminotransferase family protein [Telmatospirillum sp.]|nr:PLP-dependent aminotransferase family protein [Telmatospirillum sp.]